MAPVRSYYNWNQRKSDTNEAIEPYRKYFFICEGANTVSYTHLTLPTTPYV